MNAPPKTEPRAISDAPAAVSAPQQAEAQRHFKAIVTRAQRSTARIDSEFDLKFTTGYIVGALVFNLAAHLVFSHEVAMGLRLPAPSLAGGTIGAGLAWGALGLPAVAAIEQWRRSECSVAEEHPGECPRCTTLTNPILVGTAPLAMLCKATLGVNVGERAVEVVLANVRESESGREGGPADSWQPMCIHVGGALAACSWAQGILQPAVQLALSGAAFRLTVASMTPGDSMAADSALQLLALRHALPFVVVCTTAGIVAGVETAASRLLQPEARATTETISETLSDAHRRAERLFAYDAPPDEAARRLAAFGELATEWERTRATVARTDGAASVARNMVAAAAFAASGGSLLAPFIASLGAVEGAGEERAPPPAFGAAFTVGAVLWACLGSGV